MDVCKSAGDYDANGARTGKYVLGGDDLILNSKNESYISYADLALAIIDELKNKKFIQKRFTAVGERQTLRLRSSMS